MNADSISAHFKTYEELIKQLEFIIKASHSRITAEPSDDLFSGNVNFFTKAYLISLCTYLEAFLQDVAFTHTNLIKARIQEAKIPNNIIKWHLSKETSKEVKSKEMKFEPFDLTLSRKDLSDELSGNPGKTITLFTNIGIDLQKSSSFQATKEIVGSVVGKRNNIIHHNDNAADITLYDLLTYTNNFLSYMKSIEEAAIEGLCE